MVTSESTTVPSREEFVQRLFGSGGEGGAIRFAPDEHVAVQQRDRHCRLWPAGSGSRGAIGLLDVTIENAIKHARGLNS